MENLLGNMYCWFESFFGQNLGEHLWGFDGENYTLPIKFNTIGIIALCVSLVTVLCYYYLINHPRFSKWWSWLIVLVVNGIINLVIGYAICVSDYLDGNIADVLMYTRDDNNEIVDSLISTGDCWGFGIANFFISTIFFFGFTLLCKWKSRNAKYSPF